MSHKFRKIRVSLEDLILKLRSNIDGVNSGYENGSIEKSEWFDGFIHVFEVYESKIKEIIDNGTTDESITESVRLLTKEDGIKSLEFQKGNDGMRSMGMNEAFGSINKTLELIVWEAIKRQVLFPEVVDEPI